MGLRDRDRRGGHRGDPDRLGGRVRSCNRRGRATAWLAGSTAAAAFGGLLLSLNLTFANGYGVGPIGPDSFDEGITLDVLLIGIQAIICGVSLRTLADSRRPTLEAVPRSAREKAA